LSNTDESWPGTPSLQCREFWRRASFQAEGFDAAAEAKNRAEQQSEVSVMRDAIAFCLWNATLYPVEITATTILSNDTYLIRTEPRHSQAAMLESIVQRWDHDSAPAR